MELFSGLIFFLIPFLCGTLLLGMQRHSSQMTNRIAVLLSLLPLPFLFLIPTLPGYTLDLPWAPSIGFSFSLKIDTLGLTFILLTAAIIPWSLIAYSPHKGQHYAVHHALILFLQGFLFLFFAANDLLLFVITWELMLFPLYFLINEWGGSHKHSIAIKFLIYMIAGSALMVMALIALVLETGSGGHSTFDMTALASIAALTPSAPWIFLIFALAFAVKTPLFPFHGWLPDTYAEAPISGSILLSAVLSKAGIYGFLRIGIGFFLPLVEQWSSLLLSLAITGTLYGGFAAWRQLDYKRLIAYSSFSHVNLILIGIFAWNQFGQMGAIIQSLNHAVTITALFLLAGWLEERIESTRISHASGLAHYFPKLAWLTLFFVLASVALPGTNNFLGELMIFYSLFQHHPLAMALLVLIVVISPTYMLLWMQKMYFGHVTQPTEHTTIYKDYDLGYKQVLVALPLIAWILWIGLYPSPLIKAVESAITNGRTMEGTR